MRELRNEKQEEEGVGTREGVLCVAAVLWQIVERGGECRVSLGGLQSKYLDVGLLDETGEGEIV